MLNKFLFYSGIPLFLVGMPFALLNAMSPILDSFIYKPDFIEFSVVYSIVPFLFWFWFLGVLGFICILFKVRPKWSKLSSKYLGAYIPLFLFCIGIFLGTFGKNIVKDHLVGNGYVLIKTETIRTSFYISYDKETYVVSAL